MTNITKTVILMLILIVTCVYAADNEIKGKHMANDIACADCHNTDEPVKRPSHKNCIECHSDMTDAEASTFNDESGHSFTINIHDSHAGQLRCTLCHTSHKEPELYCNTCHSFNLQVP